MKKILTLLILTLLAASGFCTNYHVATAALGGLDGNNGLQGSPVATLNRACALAILPGDSIIFGPGVFTHTTQADIQPQVSIRGVDSVQTVINCYYSFTSQNFGAASIVFLSTTENTNGNQSISRLKLNGGLVATRGILIRGRGNVVIEKVSIQKFFVNGVALYANGNPYAQPTSRADGNIIRYSQIRNCGNGHYNGDWQGGSLIDCYGQANTLIYSNILINIDRADHNSNILSRLDFTVGLKFYYNDVWKSEEEINDPWNFIIETWNIQGGVEFFNNAFHGGGIGIDLGGSVNTKGTYSFSVKIYNNSFERATAGDENKGTHAAIHLEAYTDCSDVFAFNNTIKNFSQALLISDGTAGAASNKTRLYFFNNLAVDCQWAQTWAMPVVYLDNSESAASVWSDIYIVNNTFTGKSGKNVYGVLVNCLGTTNNIVIKNNIFYNLTNSLGIANFVNAGTRSNYIVQNNLSYLCGNNNDPTVGGTITGYSYSGQVKQDPLFVGGGDYIIQYASPARDAGQVITLPVFGQLFYNGASADIGAYEYLPPVPEASQLQLINGQLVKDPFGNLIYK